MKTPMVSRKSRFESPKNSQNQIQLLPSLQKAIDQAEDEAFDEEAEQKQLEEARIRKERAKKIREQQTKMLA